MKERILYKLNSIIIILIFCTAIFIPLSIGIFVKDKAISQLEKRKLSQLPEIPKTIKDIKAFPQLFNNYYSDHFGLREWFSKYAYKLKAKYSMSPSKDVTIGKNGWLFLGSIKKGYNRYEDPIGDVMNLNLYSQQELKQFAKYIVGLNAWLNEKGIKYIFVIAPNKHTIYFDQLPDYISKLNDRSATDQLIEYLKKHTDVPVVDLRNKLIKAKEKHQLYYKNDTHWNHYAANIAQYEIMKEIEKLFPNQIQPEMKKLRDGIRSGGDLASFIGIHGVKEHNPEPIFEQTCIPTRHPHDAKDRATHTLICDDQKLNAVIFRDSFFVALQPYFSRKFKRSTYILGKLNYSSLIKYIELEKPDIIIEEWVERLLPHVPNDHNYIVYQYKQMFYNSNELIFSKDWTQLNFYNWQILRDDKNDSLRLRATGEDPIINFPLLPIKQNNEYVLHINIVSSVQSTLQVFYSDANQTGYPFSEKNSLRFNIQKGDNDLYIALSYPNLGKHLRLDAISGLGEVVIKSLDIKRVFWKKLRYL
jgi:hypothetical protein